MILADGSFFPELHAYNSSRRGIYFFILQSKIY
jgi:hypothetical protein